MSQETVEIMVAQEVLSTVNKKDEMGDIRRARLAIALQLMKQGMSAEGAVTKAKNLVVTLFGAASD